MQSKLVLTLLMNELASKPEWSKVRVRNVNPGANKTGMTNGGSGMPWWLAPIAKFLFAAPTQGAKLLYQAAFTPPYEDASGVYLDKNKVLPVKSAFSDKQREQVLAGIKV